VDLLEHQGKEFFGRYGLPVSPGFVARGVPGAREIADRLGYPVVVKAQVHIGGRGKAGGIRLAQDAEEVTAAAESILGMDIGGHTVGCVLVEEAARIAAEYYASFTLDRSGGRYLGMLSARGGVDIEAVAESDPGSIARLWVDPVEGARVASTIGGYWAATPKGAWMVDRQNSRWNGPAGMASRWRDPWSAAFVSWVMCEGGLGSSNQFRRSIAHHVYVDQAIRARDAGSSRAGFTAYDVGETAVGPGDLLCSSRRGGYGTIAQRRRHLGVGARMHCDVVVKLEPDRKRILAIGGNVRGTVSLKLLPAALRGGNLAPTREIFAHLKLRADAIEDDALDSSPTARALLGTLSSQVISTP